MIDISCNYRLGNLCELSSQLGNKEVLVVLDDCRACCRCKHPRDVNEVTTTLAGIDMSIDSGIGTSVHNKFKWFNRKPDNCNCADRVKVMNAWGVEGCTKNLPTILSWLRQSAKDQGYPYSEFVISNVVKGIILYYKTFVEKPKIHPPT